MRRAILDRALEMAAERGITLPVHPSYFHEQAVIHRPERAEDTTFITLEL